MAALAVPMLLLHMRALFLAFLQIVSLAFGSCGVVALYSALWLERWWALPHAALWLIVASASAIYVDNQRRAS